MSVPAISVVIPSVNGWSDLNDCLSALIAQSHDLTLELLIPERCGPAVRELAAAKFPAAILIPVSSSTTIPQMRALAFDRASADTVAVIEDHVIVPEGWARALLDARRTTSVVGGGVENLATQRLVDWAAYLCEYSHMLPPLPSGTNSWITGNNTAYSKELLARFREATHAGRWEGHLHDSIRDAGISLIFRPDIMVGHKKHYTIWEYFTQRYYYARSYAGARAAASSIPRRLALGLVAFALPPVLFWRTVSRCFGKQVDRRLVWRCLPLTALFVVAWGAGDIAGAWLGEGDSLSKVC